jgi:hypothetical protein
MGNPHTAAQTTHLDTLREPDRHRHPGSDRNNDSHAFLYPYTYVCDNADPYADSLDDPDEDKNPRANPYNLSYPDP